MIDVKLVLDHCEISNEFNFVFSSIARKMNSKVYSSTLMNSTNEITTLYEISEIIRELENGKSH